MTTLPINKLKAGMVLSENIVTRQGQIIAKRGAVLDRKTISKFTFYGIAEVPVDDDFTTNERYVQPAPAPIPEPEPEILEIEPEEPEPAPAPTERTRLQDTMTYTQKLQQSSEYQQFQLDYSTNLAGMKDMFDRILQGEKVSSEDLLRQPKQLVASKTSLELLDLLHSMRSLEDSVYVHSLNVAIISRSIGRWIHMEKSEVDDLTIAALLHDIGKLTIPDEVLNKTGRLTDEEFTMIKNHTVNGKKILKAAGYPFRFQAAALQHHERSDGSGYPRGLEDDEIEEFAAIIAIADVYDAMTAARSYRVAKSPFEVIEAFENDGFQKYHTKFLLTFLEHMAGAYQNSHCMLSDGRSGRIVYINKSKLSRPMVQLEDGEMLDLSRNSNLTITKIM